MKYLVRSIKYFFYLMVILTLMIAVLIAFNFVEADMSKIFVNGYDSYWQIAAIMALFALLYPRFGFSTRSARVPGSDEEVAPRVVKLLEERGYLLEKREGSDMTFRKRSGIGRALKMWEDRLTFTRSVSGYEIEGLTKDLARIIAAIESGEY